MSKNLDYAGHWYFINVPVICIKLGTASKSESKFLSVFSLMPHKILLKYNIVASYSGFEARKGNFV